jgi:GT2 family glycosyltransferase
MSRPSAADAKALQPCDLSIIIVNWNSREYLRHCLASIQRHVTSLRYEIVVIDSASFDGSADMVRQLYPDIRYIQSLDNKGFAVANNRAVGESTGTCVLFLNPDTEVEPEAIERMFDVLRRVQSPGLVGPRLLNSDRSVQSSCIQPFPTILNKILNIDALRSLWPAAPIWGARALYKSSTDPQEVQAVSGACCMLTRSVLQRVGGFSEDYFMYAEDIDLAYKVHRSGYKNYHVPTALVVHHGGSSSDQATGGFAAVMMPEATWRFFRKTRGLVYAEAFRLAMLASAVTRLLLLGVAAPLASSHRGRIRAAQAKWRDVLKWATRRDDVRLKYYPADA